MFMTHSFYKFQMFSLICGAWAHSWQI